METLRMETLRFTKVRDVKSPSRGNDGDAGLDFYVPNDMTYNTLLEVSYNSRYIENDLYGKGFYLKQNGRVLIPSGIRVLIDQKNSMLMAANKSGVSTKTGLVYTAEIVDSSYTGEIHIGVVNTSETEVFIEWGQKLIQFIHVPVIPSKPLEISNEEYESISSHWGTRGSGGFGSTGDK
jgi:dUTPase